MSERLKKDKIQEALELLNDAAREKKEEVAVLLSDKYECLKEIVGNMISDGETIAGQTQKKILKGLHQEEKKLKEVVEEWDEKIHKDPWLFLGGAALGSLMLGLILGRKK